LGQHSKKNSKKFFFQFFRDFSTEVSKISPVSFLKMMLAIGLLSKVCLHGTYIFFNRDEEREILMLKKIKEP